MIKTDENLYLNNGHVSGLADKLQASEYTITTAKSAEEAEKIRELWMAMEPFPQAEIDYILKLVDLREEVVRPHVILISRNGQPEAMLVGIIEDVRVEFKFGYKTVFKPLVRSLAIVNGGLIGNISPANSKILITELMAALKNNEANLVKFTDIPTDSHIYQAARSIPNFMCRDNFPAFITHYKISLPASLDDFYARQSQKVRYELRKQVKRLDKTFSGNAPFKCFTTSSDVEQLCQDAAKVSQNSWQYAIGVRFINDTQTRQLLTLLAERGWLKAYVLYAEDEPIAFSYGVTYKDTYYGSFTGYDSRYRQHGPGTVLLLKIIEAMCQDPAMKYMDFGPGNQEYKRRFCDLSWEEASFYIFSPTFKGLKLNAMEKLTGAAHLLGNRILDKFQLKARWEKIKRNRAKSDEE